MTRGRRCDRAAGFRAEYPDRFRRVCLLGLRETTALDDEPGLLLSAGSATLGACGRLASAERRGGLVEPLEEARDQSSELLEWLPDLALPPKPPSRPVAWATLTLAAIAHDGLQRLGHPEDATPAGPSFSIPRGARPRSRRSRGGRSRRRRFETGGLVIGRLLAEGEAPPRPTTGVLDAPDDPDSVAAWEASADPAVADRATLLALEAGRLKRAPFRLSSDCSRMTTTSFGFERHKRSRLSVAGSLGRPRFRLSEVGAEALVGLARAAEEHRDRGAQSELPGRPRTSFLTHRRSIRERSSSARRAGRPTEASSLCYPARRLGRAAPSGDRAGALRRRASATALCDGLAARTPSDQGSSGRSRSAVGISPASPAPTPETTRRSAWPRLRSDQPRTTPSSSRSSRRSSRTIPTRSPRPQSSASGAPPAA